jgi:predicted aminopeptidase
VHWYKRIIVFAAGTLLSLALCGCDTLHYYSQAVSGEFSILSKRKPISDILADPETSARLRERLSYLLAVRQFADSELHLPVKKNYLTYVALNRPYVVWNVFAAPEFSLTPKTWCYLLVGCAAYRGYFSEPDARRYAAELNKENYDVYVAGVTAYSTLGWFDDPVLSTFIQYSKAQSAGLIFHELAHQVLYLKDDTVFNESFATAVEQEGLRRWQQVEADADMYRDYLAGYRRREKFVELISRYRQKLEALYRTDASPPAMKQEKAAIFAALQDEFRRETAAEAGLSVYAPWIYQDLNNAKIASVAAYHDFVPAFLKILAQNGGDFSRFYQVCRQLGEKNKAQRDRMLKACLAE